MLWKLSIYVYICVCMCSKSLLCFLGRALKLSNCVHMHCYVMQLFSSQSISLKKFRVQVILKKILMLSSSPRLYFVSDYLANLLTVVLEALRQLQCYSIMGNSIMQQFWFNCISVMMMSATKRYILKTHQINNSFYAYTEDSYSFFFTFSVEFLSS